MITKICKIKKLPLVFPDYTWDANLPEFKQFNLIFGWNGSGKTTLSRLFEAINQGEIEGNPDLEYEIEHDGTKHKQGGQFPRMIRVFNQSYIQKNVEVVESRTKSISIFLGEENKELVNKILADRILLGGEDAQGGKVGLKSEIVKSMAKKSSERDSKFTEIAKTIGAAIGGNALRDYRKPQAERDFAALPNKVILSGEELAKLSASAKQESLPLISLNDIAKSVIVKDGTNVFMGDALKLVDNEARTLLANTVESEIIDKLSVNSDLSNWVERGFHLHERLSSSTCEFCLQIIPPQRIKQLARHFSAADKELKRRIDSLIDFLAKATSSINIFQVPDEMRFYAELKDGFSQKKSAYEASKHKFLSEINGLVEELKNKKSKTTEQLVLEVKLDVKGFLDAIYEMSRTVAVHNVKTSGFDSVKQQAISSLKRHYLSTIFDDVKQLATDLLKLEGDLANLEAEIIELYQSIRINVAKVSSDHKACEALNDKLATFLGHQELTFIPETTTTSDDGETKEMITGYKIMRGDKPAESLSEGEKTAIAFIYYVVHLADNNFKLSDGIIVIDDPISSFDSNSLYQAFSFLKNSVKDARQVFILTHSFDFLKLLINWRRNGAGAVYYMIKNRFTDNARVAYLAKMDRELCEYESEYHYLFKLLKQMRDELDDSIAKAYPVPNVARKVWDTFLTFRVPNGKGQYKKIEELKEAGFDGQKLDAIYKFVNDQSHITGAGFMSASGENRPVKSG